MREATIHIPHSEFEKFGAGTFFSACLDAGLQNLTELACQRDGCLFVVTLESELSDSTLSSLDELQWWEQLSTSDSEAIYICKVSSTDGAEHLDAVRELDVSSNEMQVNDTGVELSIVGDQTDLAKSVEEYNNAGIRVILQRMTDYTGPSSSRDVVTERQLAILETAFERGYFEVPREVSASDIAEELDLVPSTVTEHLRRAQRNILSDFLNK